MSENQETGILLADGWEDAFVGFASYFGGDRPRIIAVYDVEKMVEVAMKRDGMTEEEAAEFIEYNTLGAHAGPNTPAYLTVKGPLETAMTYADAPDGAGDEE
jgi:hypothetical protein